MFERLGSFYVKVGQILSTRPDIVSEEMVREFRLLHDAVSVQPFAVFEPVLREELGQRWRERFVEIDTVRPLGAASLAQVYAATLHDGRLVVVKIQRPGIVATIEADMALLRRAARLVARVVPDFTEVIDVEAMLRMLFDAMHTELDFTREAQHMERARVGVAEFKHLDVPEVLLATRRVMIQSRAPGCSIRDADPAAFATEERVAIGRDLLAFMYRSYFTPTATVFHADPHPGNIFVHPGEKASLIDWGMVGRIDRNTSHGILRVLLNVALNDGHGVARAWIDMGRATDVADVPGFHNDMEALVPMVADATLGELNFGVTLSTLLKNATRRGIRSNPAIALLGKSFANVEGSIRYLAPELSITDTFRDELREIMTGLAADAISEEQLARVFLEIASQGADTIQHFQSIVRDVAKGQFMMHASQVSRLSPRTRRRRIAVAVGVAGYLWAHRRHTARNLARAIAGR